MAYAFCLATSQMTDGPRGQSRIELLQGTLDFIILQTLRWEPQHGFGLAQMIKTNSSNVLEVDTGSLYLDRSGAADRERVCGMHRWSRGVDPFGLGRTRAHRDGPGGEHPAQRANRR